MYYAWVKSGVTGSCLAMSCRVSGKGPTGCGTYTAKGLIRYYRFLSGYVVNRVSETHPTGSEHCAFVNQVLQVSVFDVHFRHCTGQSGAIKFWWCKH